MNRTPAPRHTSLAVTSTLALAGTLLLAGCGSSPAPAIAGSPTAATTSRAETTPSTTPPTTPTTPPPVAAGGSPDGLTPNQLHQLLTILEAVNPGVSTDEAALVNASLRVCTHITAREPAAAVEALITDEFANGPYRPSPEEAQAIDMAIAKTFCFG